MCVCEPNETKNTMIIKISRDLGKKSGFWMPPSICLKKIYEKPQPVHKVLRLDSYLVLQKRTSDIIRLSYPTQYLFQLKIQFTLIWLGFPNPFNCGHDGRFNSVIHLTEMVNFLLLWIIFEFQCQGKYYRKMFN